MAQADPIEESPAMDRLLAWIDGIDLPMFVVVRQPDGRLVFVHANAPLGRSAGVPTEIFAGNRAQDIFPARMAERLTANYSACLQSDLPVSYEECLMIEGRETWWQTTLSKPAGFEGQVVLGVAINMTEQKLREFASAEAVSELTARFDDLQLFSAMAAHDARSPLATVSSLVDLVLEDFADMGDGKIELLRLVSSTVDEALQQIGATLERSRTLESGVTKRTEVDLSRLCGDLAAMIDPEMRLRIDVPQARVECDEVVVQLGLRNLMTNAARYCRGRIAVTVAEAASGTQLLLDVADDGPGLGTAKSLSDLTAQGEARDGAHGFGLKSIARMVKGRGGSLEVAPMHPQAELRGAKFRITLPGHIISGSGAGPDPHGVGGEALAKAS